MAIMMEGHDISTPEGREAWQAGMRNRAWQNADHGLIGMGNSGYGSLHRVQAAAEYQAALAAERAAKREAEEAAKREAEEADALERAKAIQEKIEGLTEGRIEQLESDPDLNSVDDYFRGAMEGENVPYTDAVKAQMATSVGRSTAAAEDAQMQAAQDYLGRVGGNPNDPAYQAMLRGITGNRQTANQQAQNEIALQSALANYQARTGGAESLYQTRMGRMAQGDQMARFRANQLAKRADMGSNAPSEIEAANDGSRRIIRQRMVIGDDDIDHRPQGRNAGYGSYAPARKDSVEQRVAKKYGQNVANDNGRNGEDGTTMTFPQPRGYDPVPYGISMDPLQPPKSAQGTAYDHFLHETQFGGGRPSGPPSGEQYGDSRGSIPPHYDHFLRETQSGGGQPFGPRRF